jgi:hypothetical protein
VFKPHNSQRGVSYYPVILETSSAIYCNWIDTFFLLYLAVFFSCCRNRR